MNPAIPDDNGGLGSSFQGVVTYMMHDKRAPGRAQNSSSERVDWTACDNLFAEDPEAAWRIMASTYYMADELKRRNHDAEQSRLAAGERKAYRRSKPVKNSVFHYSLSWHPSEKNKITREEMLETARQSVATLGGSEHQALFVAHNDTPHPHVHIILSRIHPETGKVTALESRAKQKLSRFALKYNKARGTEHLAPQREINAAKRKAGLKYDQEQRMPRAMFEEERASAPEAKFKPKLARRLKAEQRAKDRALYEADRAREAGYAATMRGLEQSHQSRLDAIQSEAERSKNQVAKLIDEQFQERWDEIWARVAERTTQSIEGERTASGRLKNTLTALAGLWRSADPDATRGVMRQAFQVIIDSKARIEALSNLKLNQAHALAATQAKAVSEAHREIDQTTKDAVVESRSRMMIEKSGLQATMALERDRSSRAWDIRKAERKTVWREFSAEHRQERITDPEATREASKRGRRQFNRKRGQDFDPE